MDFELPEELRLLKENVRRFVDRELIPLEREVVNDVAMQKQLPKRLRGKAEALGLWLSHMTKMAGVMTKNVLTGKRPIGARYTLSFLSGTRQSLKFGIDRSKRIYRKS